MHFERGTADKLANFRCKARRLRILPLAFPYGIRQARATNAAKSGAERRTDMSTFYKPLCALAAAAFLAGCMGTSDADRAVIGAVIGCAAGEIIDDGKCATGAGIGAAAGALADDTGLVR